MADLYFSFRARATLAKALDYSLLTFGLEQTMRYSDRIDRDLAKLAGWDATGSGPRIIDRNHIVSLFPVGEMYAVFIAFQSLKTARKSIYLLDLPGKRQDLATIVADHEQDLKHDYGRILAALLCGKL